MMYSFWVYRSARSGGNYVPRFYWRQLTLYLNHASFNLMTHFCVIDLLPKGRKIFPLCLILYPILTQDKFNRLVMSKTFKPPP